MGNFKDLKTYLLSKKDNLVEYIKDKRSMLADNVNRVVSLSTGFVKDNSKKFVKGATTLALVGTMLVASGCGVQVDKDGNVTSFGNYVGKTNISQTNGNKNNNGYYDPNKNVDGAVIEVVDPNRNKGNSNNQQSISGNKQNNNYNDGAVIEVVNPNATTNNNNTNKQPVSTGNSTTSKEETVNDGAIIEIVGNNSSSNSNIVGGRPSNDTYETETNETTYDDIIVVNPNDNEQESYETEVEVETEEAFDDGAIIELVD